MLEETMMQDTNADGFIAGLGEEYAEEQPMEQDTNALEAQEAESEEITEAENTNEAEEQPTEETTNDTEGINTPETESNAEKPAEGLEVTFLGEKRQLTHDEAVTYAQKGMNYDRVEQQLRDSRAEIAKLEAELTAPRANENIMPLVKAYAQSVGSNLQDLTQNMLQAVRAAGITVEKTEQSSYMREKAVRDWQDFMQAYPDIKNPQAELPQEVWNAINSGLTPRAALVEYKQKQFDGKIAEKDGIIAEKDQKIAALEQEIKTLNLNAENKKKAVGSLASTAETNDRTGFLGGLLF
jgi:uncharacterized small protein (DUF1192 family)